MANKKQAEPPQDNLAIGFCLDETGSMSSCREATISGFNEFIADLAKQPGETNLAVILFSLETGEETYRLLGDCSIEVFPELSTENYRPRGMTPLFDAIGHTINRLDKVPDGVTKMLVIQTDGHENSSREFSHKKIVSMLKKREKAGWKIIFLGANLDQLATEQAAGFFGLAAGQSMSYSGQTTNAAFGAVSDSAGALRTNSAMSSLTMTERARQRYGERLEEEKKKAKKK